MRQGRPIQEARADLAALGFDGVVLTTIGDEVADHLDVVARGVRWLVFSLETLDLAKGDRWLGRGPGFLAAILDNIEAGVLYVNRPQGATTGAWPGIQAFGGWKGSGSTGKAGGSRYYVQQYMHEQSQTVVD